MFEIVNKLKNATPKELLSYAIMNEEAEVEYYKKLAEIAKKPSVKLVFKRMSEESEKHYHILKRLFKKLFPGEEPVKVEVPPVEVAPFYPKFESVADYFEALKYCMESELFAKETYELLASNTDNGELREMAMNLAAMEMEHYEELKKVYDLLDFMVKRGVLPESLKPGGYLFTDDLKVIYFLLELVEAGIELKALMRQRPCEGIMTALSGVDVLWITKTGTEKSIRPTQLPKMRKELLDFLKDANKRRKRGAIFIQNLGYLTVELGFKRVMDLILYLKDSALLYGGYLIVTANPEAFERREWAIIVSEMELIP
jgi:rubrerythrin